MSDPHNTHIYLNSQHFSNFEQVHQQAVFRKYILLFFQDLFHAISYDLVPLIYMQANI